LRIVPIVLATTNPDICRELGDRLAEIIQDRAAEQASMAKPLLLASTDMNHYESDQVTREKDQYAIAAIERLDAEELMTAARTHRISMCGLAPTTTVLYAARALGATRASLIRYATSGETSGDYDRVVGYAGFTID
ncbi:MAG: AmmeMemoRadiSam system protein B, partial [Nitrospiraceae bacterium]